MLDKVSGFGEVMLVANDEGAYRRFAGRRVRLVRDIMPGQGPIGGIHAGLSAAKGDYALALPCDMPLLPAGFAEYVSALASGGGFDIVAPFLDGRYQPLCAVYRKTCIGPMESNIRSGKNSLGDIIGGCGLRVRAVEAGEMEAFGDARDFFGNINDPRAYGELCARAAKKRRGR
jgi:molybdopterin-guanine dinucleotide biosynthesis protein A